MQDVRERQNVFMLALLTVLLTLSFCVPQEAADAAQLQSVLTVTANDAASPSESRKLAIRSGDDVDTSVATFCAHGPFRDQDACLSLVRAAIAPYLRSLTAVQRSCPDGHGFMVLPISKQPTAYFKDPMDVAVEIDERVQICARTNVSEFVPRFCSERPYLDSVGCEPTMFEYLRKLCSQKSLKNEARTRARARTNTRACTHSRTPNMQVRTHPARPHSLQHTHSA